MLAFAVIELRLSEDHFWNLTPAQFRAFWDQRQEQIKREDRRAQILANIGRSFGKRSDSKFWVDFPEHAEAVRRGDTAKQIRENFVQFMRPEVQERWRQKRS